MIRFSIILNEIGFKGKYKGKFVIFVLLLEIPEVAFEYNEMSQCIYLTLTNSTCIVLQPHNFHFHYCNLQDENL